LLLLIFGQNLRQLGIDVFLEIGKLLLLVFREIEPLLNEWRENLSWSRRATGRTKSSTRTTTRSTRKAWASTTRTSAAWTTTLRVQGSRLLGEEGRQFFLGEDSVLVGISALEERLQPRIGHFFLRQLPIHILVEGHHAGDHLLDGCGFSSASRSSGAAFIALVAFGTLPAFALSAIGRLGHRE
jgi:hypothetical protein